MSRFATLAVILVVAGSSWAQSPDWFEYDNQIGIFLTEHPSVDNAAELSCYTGGLGPVDVHVVLINPVDPLNGRPIEIVQRYHFKLVFPDHVMLIVDFPGTFGNAAVFPEIYATGGNPEGLPVIDDHCTLLTLTLGVFTEEPSDWYLSTYNESDHMGIQPRLGEGGFRDAYPASGSYEAKVFSVRPDGSPEDVVSAVNASWGQVKALFR